jgi:hypothetical protein
LLYKYLKIQIGAPPLSTTVLPKPFIETVIRIRTISAENSDNDENLTNFINTLKFYLGEEEYKLISQETDNALSSISKWNFY